MRQRACRGDAVAIGIVAEARGAPQCICGRGHEACATHRALGRLPQWVGDSGQISCRIVGKERGAARRASDRDGVVLRVVLEAYHISQRVDDAGHIAMGVVGELLYIARRIGDTRPQGS